VGPRFWRYRFCQQLSNAYSVLQYICPKTSTVYRPIHRQKNAPVFINHQPNKPSQSSYPSIPHSNTLIDPIRSPPSSPRSAVALSLHKFNRIDAMSVKIRLCHHVIVRIHARALIRLFAIDGGDLSHVCVGRAARLREGPDVAVAPGPTAESHVEAVGLPVDIDTAH